ncbi:type II toxin-antitoxin system RelE/ParE family toxin [Segnochrobactraceae bacterium EtOH-i3]
MRVAISVAVARFLKKQRIAKAVILNAATEIENGLVDARLGDFLFKKRLPRAGQGKRGAYRTIVIFVKDRPMSVFLWI